MEKINQQAIANMTQARMGSEGASPKRGKESDGFHQFRKSWPMRLISRDKIFAIRDSRESTTPASRATGRSRYRRRDHSMACPGCQEITSNGFNPPEASPPDIPSSEPAPI
ncbi:hypothetical protein [Cupriavidus sp. AcVe19-6a]|uniref:hypothetical protein n=1 Tax=Cupriavidus sp. AcVe19-6a TaxID=2821358 RepID=UPI001AE1BAF3|nr:hypothetical protein [Cupriavidus sp. AcVe19-6a]